MHKRFMRKVIFLLAAVLTISCGSFAFAAETTEYPEIPLDMLEYTGYEDDESGVEIETITIYDCDSNIQGNWTIPAEINGKPVTQINSDAFDFCEELTGIVIPEGVTSIGSEAFYWCPNLKNVTIPSTVTSIGSEAFYYCENLKIVNIKSVESWLNIEMEDTNSNPLREGYGGLYINGAPLKAVNIPEGITEIWDGAFYSCSDITSVIIPEGVTSIGEWAFYGCSFTSIMLPKSLKEIGGYAFCYCDELTSISIPRGITCIARSTFEDCAKLTKATLPEGITAIEGSAFYGCKSLKDVNIPSTVKSLGTYLFTYCESLTSITIPEGVTSLGAWTFRDCKWLAEVNLPESLESIGIYAFWNCISLRSIDIPENVTSIGYSAFRDCINLSTIIIPEGMKTLESGIFSGCKKLTNAVVPKNITVIEWSAFERCTSLTNITIPKNVQDVGNNVFKNCTALNTAIFQGDVTTFGENVFSGCENATIYIQAQAANLIKNLDLYGYNYKIGVSSSGRVLASVLTVEFPKGKTTYDYTGKTIQPEMKVSLGSTVLKKGTDYTVSYKNNINTGTATVTITGIGNYEGTITKNFTIRKRNMSGIKVTGKTVTYNGKSHTITMSGVPEGAKVYYKTSANGTYSTNKPTRTNAGTTTVYYKVSKANYNDVTGSTKIVVNKRSISKATLAKTTYVYTGKALKPSTTVKNSSGTVLTKGTHYTVIYKNNTKVGKATVTITGKGNYKGTITKTFKINPKATKITSLTKGNKAFTVKWSKKTTQTTGYQIYYSTSKSRTNGKQITISKNTTTSKKITNLKSKKKYYVWVRTYKTVDGVKYYSTWSDRKYVTTK